MPSSHSTAAHPQPPAIALMGPTASGKTRLAIALAKALNGEIISVDSALVYRGMDIGTAKPDQEERAGVPHHLIDILDPAEAYSTGRFRHDALTLMADITQRGHLPILAGGTMLYFNGLERGLADLPTADPGLRAQLEADAAQRGWEAMHAELVRLDPEAAARIHPKDPQRIQRALEVWHLTGIPLSELCKAQPPRPLPYRLGKLVLAPSDRPSLHARIRDRFMAMLDRGLIEEVLALHDRSDLHADLPALRAVGYRQVWQYLEGRYERDELIERAVIATRQFAKRQMTWLRRESTALRYAAEDPGLLAKVLGDVETFIDTAT